MKTTTPAATRGVMIILTTTVMTAVMMLMGTARPADAQDISFGYQFQRTSCCDGKSDSYPAGFNVDFSGPVSPALDILGQVDWSRRSDDGDSETITAFGAGVRWNFAAASASARPFLDVLFGAAYDSREAGSDTNPGMQIGGGVAIPMNPKTAAVLQVDFRRAFKDGGDTNAVRFVGGLRLGFKK
jgi:hypothetical protein